MNSFVKSLYYGEVSPWERDRPKDPEYKHIASKISGLQKYFQNTLPAEQLKKLEELEILHAQASSIESLDNFAYGLNMGILIMVDAIDFKIRS